MKKSIFLFFVAILCSVSAWAYNYGGSNVYYYFANTGSWPGVHLYIFNGTWNQDFTLTKIANTNVYYHKWSSAYNNNEGILFRGAANWNNGQTSDIKKDYTSHTSWVHNNTTGKTDLSNINRSAQVAVKLSTGGDYTQTANANCVATVSGYTVEKGKSSATTKSASTSESSATASISAAYGSTITYTATAGTGYTFEGFSTSNSKTLPATKSASGKTATASGYGSTNNSTYYAYFKANQYTVKFDANGGTGSMLDQSHTYSVSQALTANTFTRKGYTFEGWNTQADGTGTSYTDKQSVSNLSSTDGETITLYAQWAEIPANNHNITYTTQATGWTYGAQPASAEEGSTVAFEVIPTTGYTVTVTSDDVTLNKNENEYTFTMPTTDVAIDVTATENTHDVTISYKCGDQTIQANGTATAVGEITAKEITAPEITGYKFTSWTLGDGIDNKSANTTTNPINITTKASGTYTLTANYEKVVTVYFVNSSKWTAVNCHHWPDGGSGTSWPGDKLTTTGETVNEFDVYRATFSSKHDMCIFSNNGASQTANLEVQDGKYYYPLKSQWYASLNDIPAIDPLATNVFLVGAMNGWSTNTDEFRKETKDATTASIILNLNANTDYEFKVIRDGAWTGYKGTITKDASGLQFSSSTGDNAKITTTVAGDYTFTWTISSSKLAVTYPTICAITATANDAAMGAIAGAGEYGKGSTATLTATPNDGYLFVNWTKGGVEVSTDATYSFEVEEAVALVANFEAAPEEVHNVTVSYVCGDNKIAEDQTVAAVGETTPKTAEAPEIWGYTFSSWTLGAGVTSTDATANPISINIVAGGDYTLTANYTEIPKVKVYVVNNKKWSKVNVYGWKEGEAQGTPAWPGQEITANLETEKVAGFDVYSYSVVPSSYDNLIINNGTDQTETYKWTDGKYYYVGAAENYAGGTAEEVATALGATTSYDYYIYGNMNDWKEDENYGMTDEDEDGVYEKTLTLKNNAEFKVKGTDWYGFDAIEGTYKETSGNEGNVKISLSADTEVTVKFNSETKKITFEGLTEIVPKYYLVGTFNAWNPADPNYEMTLDGGLYKKEVTFAKDVQFKVCNGSWDASWGKNNLGGIQYNELTEQDDNIKMKEAKTFTVIFNPAENLILFEGLTEKVTYVLMGVNGDWETGIELVPNPKQAGEYMLLGQPIAKATDAVKIVKIEGGNKTQYCQFDDVKGSSVACTEGDHKNIVLEDGVYDFYYEVSANKVYIAAATPYTREVRQGYYGTICLPTAGQMVGASIFEIAYKDASKSKIYFDEIVSGKMEAGIPYIFLPNEGVTTLKVFYTEMAVVAAGSRNGLVGYYDNTDNMFNVLVGNYILLNNQYCEVVGTNAYIMQNYSYIVLEDVPDPDSAPALAPGARRVSMGVAGQNTATGVDQVEGDNVPTKMIINGQLFILRGEKMYDAQGKLVK